MQWAISMGGSENDVARSVVVDLQGDAYVAGSFNSSAVFGSNSTRLVASDPFHEDAFLMKVQHSPVLAERPIEAFAFVGNHQSSEWDAAMWNKVVSMTWKHPAVELLTRAQAILMCSHIMCLSVSRRMFIEY